MENSLKSNIPKLYIIRILRWFMLIMPIVVLFFQSIGLDMQEILILQAVFSVCIVLFEVPSGYFADRVGRKTSIILGIVFGFGGLLTYCFSYGFWGVLLGEIILAIGASFISGSDSAMIYDTLLALDKSNDYTRIEGRYSSLGNFSEGVAAILGGVLATVFLRLPLYIYTGVMFLALPFAISLTEPPRHTAHKSISSIKHILQIVKFALIEHTEIKWLILYSALIGASTLTMVWFIQPYFKLVGLPLEWFGVAWAILQFSVGIFAWFAASLEKFLGRKKSLISLIFLNCIAFVLIGVFQQLWAISFIFIFYFVRGFSTPVIKDYINKLTTSDKRATVLSVKNMVGRLMFAVVGPFIGWANDMYSLRIAMLLSAGIFFVFGLFFIIMMAKNRVFDTK